MPARKAIHAIVDNYATHKHPKVRQWLARHPRWTFHFTPTSASWLNAVEGFFAKLTKRRLKRGVFLSVVDLQAAINRFVVEHNVEPKPFTWTADPEQNYPGCQTRAPSVRFDPLDLWPSDRNAWNTACQPAARLKRGGVAGHLKPVTRDDLVRSYGCFLDFLDRHGLLRSDEQAAVHVTVENVHIYIAELKDRVGSVTVHGSISKLRRAAQFIAPGRDSPGSPTSERTSHSRCGRARSSAAWS